MEGKKELKYHQGKVSGMQKNMSKGETDKALELLDSKVKEVKLKDKATELSSLMIPIKEDELKQRQANKPESLNSGYTIGGGFEKWVEKATRSYRRDKVAWVILGQATTSSQG